MMVKDLESMTAHLGKLGERRGNNNNDRHGGGNDRGGGGGGGRHHSAGHRGSLGVSGASGIGKFIYGFHVSWWMFHI